MPVLLLLFPVSLPAQPDGKDLLTACEAALENNFTGIEAQMCHWYVTPCDCDVGKEVKGPRVCLPESVPAPDLARQVISGLTREPELGKKNATLAAAIILSKSYPCQDAVSQ